MLTRELMGYVALWVLWGNTVLVALAALKQLAPILATLRALRPLDWKALDAEGTRASGSFVARVVGPKSIGELVIDQLGRAMTGPERAIVWHDRGYRSLLRGGTLLATTGQEIAVSATDQARVWFDPEEVEAVARSTGEADFNAVYHDARRVRGHARSVVTPLPVGPALHVVGEFERAGGGIRAVLSADAPLLIATSDPRRFCRSRLMFTFAVFLPAIFAGAALTTWLALTPPVFDGLVSKIGGASALVFFLVVLPAGTALRDYLRMPHLRILRGKWTAAERSSSAAASA